MDTVLESCMSDYFRRVIGEKKVQGVTPLYYDNTKQSRLKARSGLKV